MRNRALAFVSFIFLIACAAGTDTYALYLQKRGVDLPTVQRIDHCRGYGCQIISTVSLNKNEWQEVAAIFWPAAQTAAEERARIAKAVGLLERIIGPKDGTDHDIAGTFRKGGHTQLDCVDESTNTTTYLALFQSKGLLKFHAVQGPTMRLPIFNAGSWPHQTAVIRENKTGADYAVDSWFRDNGAPADIIDLKKWKSGWKPENVHGFL